MTTSNPSVSLHKSSAPPPLPPSFQSPQLLPEPRRCDAGAGMVWIRKAFDIMKKNFWLWLGMTLTAGVILGLFSTIPILGIVISLIGLVFMGGLMKAAAAQERGETLTFSYLFSAFETHLKPLLILGGLYFLGIIAISIVMVGFLFLFALGGTFDSMMIADNMNANAVLMTMLFMFLLSVPITGLVMSLWFSPPLIVLHDVAPLDAMKKSLQASLRNWLPMLVMGVVFGAIGLLLTIFTLGIGLLLAMPMVLLMYYTSYRDVWTDQPLSVDE